MCFLVCVLWISLWIVTFMLVDPVFLLLWWFVFVLFWWVGCLVVAG